jgi:hypothetical protein
MRPVYRVLDPLVLVQELGHAAQAVLHAARRFLAFGHGHEY